MRGYLVKRASPTETVDGFSVPAAQWAIRKVAALAADLRMKGLAGVKRPAFPTAESTQQAENKFKETKQSTTFKGFSKPSTLTKPGPSIAQVATTPPTR